MIGFSGSRKLTPRQRDQVLAELATITIPAKQWHVGDADGLDALVREYNPKVTVHLIDGKQRWHFAQRSQRLIDTIGEGGVLYAFPNKPCPEKCTPAKPFCGHGSGTWGTVAYAKKKGLDIELHPLTATAKTPDWLKQLSLF